MRNGTDTLRMRACWLLQKPSEKVSFDTFLSHNRPLLRVTGRIKGI